MSHVGIFSYFHEPRTSPYSPELVWHASQSSTLIGAHSRQSAAHRLCLLERCSILVNVGNVPATRLNVATRFPTCSTVRLEAQFVDISSPTEFRSFLYALEDSIIQLPKTLALGNTSGSGLDAVVSTQETTFTSGGVCLTKADTMSTPQGAAGRGDADDDKLSRRRRQIHIISNHALPSSADLGTSANRAPLHTFVFHIRSSHLDGTDASHRRTGSQIQGRWMGCRVVVRPTGLSDAKGWSDVYQSTSLIKHQNYRLTDLPSSSRSGRHRV